MDDETTLARNLRVYDKQAAYDYASKKLLSERSILAWILKHCVKEFEDCPVEEIAAEYIQGPVEIEQTPIRPDETNAPQKKRSPVPSQIETVGLEETFQSEGANLYDIRFYARVPGTDELLYLIINIEVQRIFYPSYPLLKRGVFNVSRQISSQYGPVFSHSHYEKIRKVYTIFICPSPSKAYQNTITRYRMREENLVGEAHAPEKDYDLTTVIMVCLGSAGDKNYDGLLKMLDVLLSSTVDYPKKKQILEEEFDIPMTETMEQEALEMFDLSQDIAERNLEKGRVEGRVEGRMEGRMEGHTETLLNNLRSLMKGMKWSIDQAMNALEVPESDRPKCRELLGQQ